jgi:hypothetical protein
VSQVATPTLLDRLREATGSDRELDADLCLALTYSDATAEPLINPRRSEDDPDWMDYEIVDHGKVVDCTDVFPALTASIDAALALVERKLPRTMWRLQSDPDTGDGFRCTLAPEVPPVASADGATATLAILIALLTALESLSQNNPETMK